MNPGGSRVEGGLIPAHAGKTPRRREHSPRLWAHPRSRGENITNKLKQLPGWGSSPLTRGKLRVLVARSLSPGLIPAHAGKTEGDLKGHGWYRAHPRSRGENNRANRAIEAFGGSSPLTRGKRGHELTGTGSGGLIPAHAGKTRAWPTASRRCWAHPRSRGENMVGMRRESLAEGSSPLTRGKPCSIRHTSPHGGLIPAHAGKTPHRASGQR